jgi:hypothetical protein
VPLTRTLSPTWKPDPPIQHVNVPPLGGLTPAFVIAGPVDAGTRSPDPAFCGGVLPPFAFRSSPREHPLTRA